MELPDIQLPQELLTSTVLLAGLAALAGVLLWSSGIKVARALSTVICGITLATVCGIFLQGPTGVPGPICAAAGLAVGLTIGAMAYDVLQAVALAGSSAVSSAVVLYALQMPAQSMPTLGVTIHFTNPFSNPEQGQAAMRLLAAQWQAIPLDLRQRMMVLGAGIAIIAFAVAFVFPKRTTWFFTAAGGAGMIVGGLYVIARLRNPALLQHLPASPMLLGALSIFVLVGMLVQHALFWPGRVQKRERARDQGQPVPA